MGMLVELSYCTEANAGLPCRNIIGCWKERMDILSFLRQRFSDDQLKEIFSGPAKSRIDRIIEEIQD